MDEKEKDTQRTDSGSKEQKEHTQPADPSDDEIVLDFSKLKSLFKGKKEEQPPRTEAALGQEEPKKEHQAGSKESDEINIDFTKIKAGLKNLFAGSEEKKDTSKGQLQQGATEADNEELNIDWQKAGTFLKRYGTFFIILIPFILAIYLRMMSVDVPMTDNWAQQSVIESMRSQIQSQIAQQYPNLPPANRESLVNSEIQRQLDENGAAVQRQIESTSSYFKQYFRDPEGNTYMPDIDPYYWQRYAQNVLDNGHPGDLLVDGRPYDDHQLAPKGRFVAADMFHSYFLAYFHKFTSFLSPDTSLRQTVSIYPVVVSAVSTVLVFLIAAKITGNLGALVAAIFFTINSTFLGRTLYGHGDSDAWVLFFPVFTLWLFFEMFERDKLWKTALVGGAAGAAVGLFSFAWNGWWYIFDFILIAAIASFGYLVISHYKEVRQDLRGFLRGKDVRQLVTGTSAFAVIAAIGVTIVWNFSTFISGITGPLTFSTIKSPVSSNLWPNVLTTVAELNTGNVTTALNSVGGKPLFFLSVLGILLLFLRRFDTKELVLVGISALYYAVLVFQGDSISTFFFVILLGLPWAAAFFLTILQKGGSTQMLFAVVLVLWYVASIYAVSKGVRFTLLLAPAFGIALGVAISRIHALFMDWAESGLSINRTLSSILFIGALLIWMFAGPVNAASQTASGDVPLVNDVWWNSLKAIEDNSTEDAILTSWWDFGHHFKQISGRPVTFDGTTQTHQAAHWVGRMFMTSDEQTSIGILRMLDCGSDQGFDILNAEVQDTVRSVNILYSIITQDRARAASTLQEEGVSQETAEQVLEKTHCAPPEGFVIASEDMIGKSGVWAHFGSWDFVRADVWFNAKNMPVSEAVPYLTDRYDFTEQEAENLYFEARGITSDEEANRWVSPWPGYGSGTSCSRSEEGSELFVCQNGFRFNYTSKDTYAVSGGETVRPNEIAYVTRTGVELKSFNDTQVGAGITFVPSGPDSFRGIVSSPELTGSLFTRMFHLDGHGLYHFDQFYQEQGLTGTEVKVYTADWQGGEPRIVQRYVDLLDQIENGTATG